jgi:hypothetical protein
MDRYRYYRLILSVMLATNSIIPSVKNFSLLTESMDHRFKKNFFDRIESSAQERPSISSMFISVYRLSVSIQSMFFRHQCPPMVKNRALHLSALVQSPQRKRTQSKLQKDCTEEKSSTWCFYYFYTKILGRW